MKRFYKKAFTLSEVLLALAVVGILAALVVPGLMNEANKKMFATQIKSVSAGIMDLALEQIAESPSKDLKDTDFASPATLLSSSNFDVAKTCSTGCWGNKYKSLKNDNDNDNDISPIKMGSIQLKNGVVIGYMVYIEGEMEDYSATNTSEHYFGLFSVDVNGTDKPNILGRDYFEFYVTNKGRIGNNLANEKTKDELRTMCVSGGVDPDLGELTSCLTYLELNGWRMDY